MGREGKGDDKRMLWERRRRVGEFLMDEVKSGGLLLKPKGIFPVNFIFKNCSLLKDV